MHLVKLDTYRLSTGREFEANRGVIGLDPRDGEVSEGYDGEVYCAPTHWDAPQRWTDAERVELATYMIAAWTAWRARFQDAEVPHAAI